MRNSMRPVVIALFSFSVVLGSTTMSLAGQPISSDDIVQLHKLGINSVAIVQKIKSDGVGFVADTAALHELAEQGVPTEVLAAIQEQVSAPTTNTPLITYTNVKQLVELGIDESAVIQRLSGSPTSNSRPRQMRSDSAAKPQLSQLAFRKLALLAA